MDRQGGLQEPRRKPTAGKAEARQNAVRKYQEEELRKLRQKPPAIVSEKKKPTLKPSPLL